MPQDINTYEEIKAFLTSKKRLRMSHIYKPVMLLEVLRRGGNATRAEIAQAFLERDAQQLEFYRRKVVHPSSGRHLVRDGLLVRDGQEYRLADPLAALTAVQRDEIEEILERRIAAYQAQCNPFGDHHRDAVPASRRFAVLERAGGRCELCGVSCRATQIDVTHIVPRARGGSNDTSNLQALCRACCSQRRERDDTDYAGLHERYAERDSGCVFCRMEQDRRRVVAENPLAFCIRDGFPLVEGHMLVMPRRHVADYFDLTQAERNAIEELMRDQRRQLAKADASITGWGIDISAGASAEQTVFHVHFQLNPRRDGLAEPAPPLAWCAAG
jgi:diadenosine tetraphosphate (Ap4A) HIT family hydrolase